MDFDWALAIKRNSEALKGIIAALFAMLGLEGEAVVGRIPQPLHRAVLRVLGRPNPPCAALSSSQPAALW